MQTRSHILVVGFVLLLAARPPVARAGGINEQYDIIHLRPFIGYEISRVGAIEGQLAGGLTYKTDTFNASGLAWGGNLGFRIGPISLDALFQHTDFATTSDGRDVDMNKLYLDLGFNLGHDWIRSTLDIAFGYSFLDLDGLPRQQGFGGRIGASLDFYPARWFSVGPTASFDAQGYTTKHGESNGVIGAYGGTFTLRIGFHL